MAEWEGARSGMLEAMDGRKQAHMDVLVAVPLRDPSRFVKSFYTDAATPFGFQQKLAHF
ncbi:hypothetical protein DEU29_101138 [Idiomarina aquatica]|uniref:Uncharacterized protein n=1 Tax=Idiomarina aquatica TaxID=1327752 RepID=A0A4R6PRM3_9GAMM|nr:hypothetical protein DEU29_101138 [Idiomarina aquatica]